MFIGFSKEAFDFMNCIRLSGSKEWFEEHKKIYLDCVFHPMKELSGEVFEPFKDIKGMMCRACRIYSDPNFPPYRSYRDKMWIIMKHETYDWSKTPSLFFELSAEGAVFGLKLTHPAAAVMEKFRQRTVTDGGEFIKLAESLESSGYTIGGDEYKRPKPCDNASAERFFKKKSLVITRSVPLGDELLYSPKLAEAVIETFKKLLPINEMFEEFVSQALKEKAESKAAAYEPELPKAPTADFMW